MMSKESIILYKKDKNLLLSMALILERAGYCIAKTDDVYKALDLIRSQDYSLVITDLDLPATRSILLPHIQDLDVPISTVIFTDQPVSEIEQEKQAINFYYLEKPVAPERLLEFIEDVLSQDVDQDIADRQVANQLEYEGHLKSKL